MKQQQNLLQRLSNVFSKDENSLLGQLFGAIGSKLDELDPAQTQLQRQFAMFTANGEALDRHGQDWGVYRRDLEADEDYRRRIQAVLPIYTNGPTVQAISDIVRNFTGAAPVILEFGPYSFTMGVTPMGDFMFNDRSPFEFEVQVQNPEGVTYKKNDLEMAVQQAKPARATVTFVHQGGI
ncbi:hypothetical protein JJB07_06160 [Tumebacillus sp. ITR2]|uniref:DUF2313 domain-containing protein n=1 Tax=Tumebacillus amylolyticus TaxID=2801339 RepID=A0ABS1J7Q3_9BACL|nr:hypothetical protein [Tumebacillus amylolyticus]MBL0386235.1 hypothetical protein [Tumebacillus amylolyticus]